jgi:hypothetical protein
MQVLRKITVGVVTVSLAACSTETRSPEDDKAAARAKNGKADDGTDICAKNGWYGDRECDTFCPEFDIADCFGQEPDDSCMSASDDVITKLEAQNGRTVTIGKHGLLNAYSNREMFEVAIARDGNASDWYLVNSEAMGTDRCLVYGLELKSDPADLRDTGTAATGMPSSVCAAAAVAAVSIVQTENDETAQTGQPELVTANSDRELIRLPFVSGDKADSYLVDSESPSGNPCMVDGLQLKSEQINLQSL